jgi:hypothetical protein
MINSIICLVIAAVGTLILRYLYLRLSSVGQYSTEDQYEGVPLDEDWSDEYEYEDSSHD